MSLVRKNKWLITAVAVVALVAGTALTLRVTSTDGPKYSTLSPKNTSIKELGGWQRVSPPESDPVYAYTDKIEGVTVSVSQQPLPQSFKKNTAQEVSKLAKSYNASRQLKAGNVTIYVGASAKGPESAIFVKESVLVLIKSQAAVSDEAWVSYTKNLQ